MKSATKISIAFLALVLPFAASAQGGDAAYCAALADQYQKYIVKMIGHTTNPGSVDATLAIDQCKAGNTGAGIPVLEQKLHDARIALPERG
ncbi:MAG: hypothetical protein ACHQK9_23405 [Reyranellales bacterium]